MPVDELKLYCNVKILRKDEHFVDILIDKPKKYNYRLHNSDWYFVEAVKLAIAAGWDRDLFELRCAIREDYNHAHNVLDKFFKEDITGEDIEEYISLIKKLENGGF